MKLKHIKTVKQVLEECSLVFSDEEWFP